MGSFLNNVIFLCLVRFNYGQQDYFIDEHLNCNNVWGAVNNADESSQFVRFLGIFKSTEDCINACIQNSTINTDDICYSYTYHTSKFDEPYTNHCYGRFGSQYGVLWTPLNQNDINCGRIIWKCKSNIDCQLNGICESNGNCTCRNGWSGYRCQSLNLLPATKGTGYHITNDNNSGKPTSSWGGASYFIYLFILYLFGNKYTSSYIIYSTH